MEGEESDAEGISVVLLLNRKIYETTLCLFCGMIPSVDMDTASMEGEC